MDTWLVRAKKVVIGRADSITVSTVQEIMEDVIKNIRSGCLSPAEPVSPSLTVGDKLNIRNFECDTIIIEDMTSVAIGRVLRFIMESIEPELLSDEEFNFALCQRMNTLADNSTKTIITHFNTRKNDDVRRSRIH